LAPPVEEPIIADIFSEELRVEDFLLPTVSGELRSIAYGVLPLLEGSLCMLLPLVYLSGRI
jgi:hypothetical protein